MGSPARRLTNPITRCWAPSPYGYAGTDDGRGTGQRACAKRLTLMSGRLPRPPHPTARGSAAGRLPLEGGRQGPDEPGELGGLAAAGEGHEACPGGVLVGFPLAFAGQIVQLVVRHVVSFVGQQQAAVVVVVTLPSWDALVSVQQVGLSSTP